MAQFRFFDKEFYCTGDSNLDYALIRNFYAGDTIQLHGCDLDYVLGAVEHGLPSGTGIFFKTSPDRTDLIGIVEGVPLSSLDLTGSPFLYVQYKSQTRKALPTKFYKSHSIAI